MFIGAASVDIARVTLTQNRAIGGSVTTGTQAHGGAMFVAGGPVVMGDSIVWQNVAAISAGIEDTGANLSISYCDVEGGWGGVAILDADPLFTTGPESSFYLSQISAGQVVDSPCVDAGDPATSSVAGSTRTDHSPDVGIVDLGFHVITTEDFIRGDANADGAIDVSDAIFALSALFVAGADAPSCADSADANDDGALTSRTRSMSSPCCSFPVPRRYRPRSIAAKTRRATHSIAASSLRAPE